MKRKYYIALACLLLSVGTYGQSSKAYSYALPQNALKIKVRVSEYIYHKGPFADYAQELGGVSTPIIQENDIQYALSQVQLEVLSLPDTTKIYPISVSHPMFAQVANKGLLVNMGINTTCSNTGVFDFEQDVQAEDNKFYMYKASDMMLQYDTTYVEVIEDSVAVKRPRITSHWVAKPNSQMASEVIDEIEDIRSDYYDLISGAQESDYTNLELMLQELKHYEENLVILFTGYKQTLNTDYDYIFSFPSEEYADEIICPLLVVSETDGVIQHYTRQAGQYEYTLKLKRMDKDNVPALAKVKHAFPYRKPAYYQVWLMENEKVKQYMGIIPIAQYGSVLLMDSGAMYGDIDAATGALKNIKVNGKQER